MLSLIHIFIYMGHTVEMPPKELELLYFLASSPNHVFTREQLLDCLLYTSPKLKSIRRSKLSTNEKIHSQLTSMVNGAYRTFLQDAVITMRDVYKRQSPIT